MKKKRKVKFSLSFIKTRDWTTVLLICVYHQIRQLWGCNQACAPSSETTFTHKTLSRFIHPSCSEVRQKAELTSSDWSTSRKTLVWLNRPSCTSRWLSVVILRECSKLVLFSELKIPTLTVIFVNSLASIWRWPSTTTILKYWTWFQNWWCLCSMDLSSVMLVNLLSLTSNTHLKSSFAQLLCWSSVLSKE